MSFTASEIEEGSTVTLTLKGVRVESAGGSFIEVETDEDYYTFFQRDLNVEVTVDAPAPKPVVQFTEGVVKNKATGITYTILDGGKSCYDHKENRVITAVMDGIFNDKFYEKVA